MATGRAERSLRDSLMAALISVRAEGSTLEDIAGYLATDLLSRRDIEDALGLLVAAGVISIDGTTVRRSRQADEIESLADGRRASLLDRIAEDNKGADPIRLDPAVWSAAEREFVRERARARLSVVEALIWAVEHPHDVIEVSAGATDRVAAVAALQTMGWREYQAQHILDTTFGRTTASAVADLYSERDGLLRQTERPPLSHS